MKLIYDINPSDFLEHTQSLLEKEEAINNLILGLGWESARHFSDDLIFVRVVENNNTIACGFCMKSFGNLVLSRASENSLKLIAQDFPYKLQGVVGPAKESDFFASYWAKIRNCKLKLGMDQLIYSLEAVIDPKPVEGSFHMADLNRLDQLTEWALQFIKESVPNENRTREKERRSMEKRIRSKSVYLWMLNHEPVSMACFSRETPNGVCVSGVYTPPQFRKRGFASAVTAELSKVALNKGKKFCCLYTDRSNPTSNGIYTAIGYTPICESRHHIFLY